MIETISIKSVENTLIELINTFYVMFQWLSDIITNMDEKDTTVIDGNNPSLSEKSLRNFKKLCEMNHHSSAPQQDEKFRLYNIIKEALPVIEKWDCPGLLRMLFNDINNCCKKSEISNNVCYEYDISDIIKYEELVTDEYIHWDNSVFLFIIRHIKYYQINKQYFEGGTFRHSTKNDLLELLDKFKKSTRSNIIIYMLNSIQLKSSAQMAYGVKNLI